MTIGCSRRPVLPDIHETSGLEILLRLNLQDPPSLADLLDE